MSTTVKFTLTQETKNKSRKVSDVKYTYGKNVKLDYAKLAKVMADNVWNRLAQQRKTGMDLGVKISQTFNIIVTINDKQTINLSKLAIESSIKNQVKINRKNYNEDKNLEKEAFIAKILVTLELSGVEHSNLQTVAVEV